MDDLAFSGGGDSSWYGPTRNPWDHERTAGGSSSGAAAALFYDGIDLAVGCDQGGSIRAPASWCGVVGLKPTHWLVPYTGIAGIDATFDHCGPLARTAEGAALLLQAIAGEDPGDPRQREVPRADYSGAVEHARRRPERPAHRHRLGGLLRGRGRRAGDLRRRAGRGRAARAASGRSCTSARCPSISRPAAWPLPASSRA